MSAKKRLPEPGAGSLMARLRLLFERHGQAAGRRGGRPKMLTDELPPGSCMRTSTPPDLSDFFAPDQPPDDWPDPKQR